MSGSANTTTRIDMLIRKFLAGAALVVAFLGAAQATTVNLPTNGTWAAFDVDQVEFGTAKWVNIDNGTDLGFAFTVPVGLTGVLTVVDAGFAGDRFDVLANTASLGSTGAAVNSYPNSIGLDFDVALADPNYSRAVFTLAAGDYLITGRMSLSALDDLGASIDASVGGLNVMLVPEPATYLTLLAGLGLLTIRRRRGT
jgi:hypothetical protein